jgi:hypothetical protein
MTETCMCWGCDCGDGWYDILEELCEKVKDVPDLQFGQVKEKFGGLRVYPDVSDAEMKEVYAAIGEATEKSYATCEYCGDPGELDKERAWIRTLCPTCRLN